MAMLICIRRQGWHGVAVVVFALLVLEKCCMKAVDATGDGSGDGASTHSGTQEDPSGQQTLENAPDNSAASEKNPQQSSLDWEQPQKPVDRLHSVSERDKNVLLGAAITGDLLTVRRIIESGVSPETHNVLGWTPLNLAALAGRLEVVRYLILQAGANRETREIYGQTPLGSASINGHTEVVRFLLNLDPMANVSAQDLDGATPLHYAAQFGYADVCYALLEKGADSNAVVPQNGWTPLHAAAAAGQVDTVQTLLEFRADKERRDSDGNKPSQIIGLTLQVTKRKMKRIQCSLDPGAVFGGCGESNQYGDGHQQGQHQDQSQDQQQQEWTSSQAPPPPFNPGDVTPGDNIEVTNGSNHTRNGG